MSSALNGIAAPFELLLCFVGVWFFMLLIAFYQMGVAKIFGLRIRSFKLFRWRFRSVNGSIKAYKEKFSFSPIVDFGPAPNQKFSKGKDIASTIVAVMIPGIVGIMSAVLYFYLVMGGEKNGQGLAKYFFVVFLGIGFMGVIMIVLTIVKLPIYGKNLHNYSNQMIREIRAADSPFDLELPRLEELTDYKRDKYSELAYQNACFTLYEARRNMERMDELAKWLEIYKTMNLNVMTAETSSQKALYLNLFKYYTTWRIDPAKSTENLRKFGEKEMYDDPDPNGKRMIAYYHNNVLMDTEGAKKYCLEGIKALDDPNTPMCNVELYCERQLLNDLLNVLEAR
ncbi:MAG: hypothetical protein J6U54_24170 [Clostridiales bacterium]|nr:hypothetical protein [Clostridiales bacterium]